MKVRKMASYSELGEDGTGLKKDLLKFKVHPIFHSELRVESGQITFMPSARSVHECSASKQQRNHIKACLPSLCLPCASCYNL